MHTPNFAGPIPTRRALRITLAAVCIAVGFALAGPLTPPAGTVTSTYKTLSEVEPRIPINAANAPGDVNSLFRITQRGSYYLVGNITGVAGKHGIEIAAPNVTLDLNGFALVGVAGMGEFDGILSVADVENVSVLNGAVSGWGRRGIDLRTAHVCRLDGLSASHNGNAGISAGHQTALTACIATENAAGGIDTGEYCSLVACNAVSNGGWGIWAGGVSTLSGCSAYDNANIGIGVDPACTLTGCAAYWNATSGIYAGTGCTITQCTALSNFEDGIFATRGSIISYCSVGGNDGFGIGAGHGSTVIWCTVRENKLDGIECSSSCHISNNTCSSNGFGVANSGANIFANGGDNRIEHNNCVDADRGIDIDATGNIILGNSCAGNTINYTIVAGNRYGPIIDITASGTAAANGSSAAGTLGSTDPNANFAY